jgi:hypothetical protein
MTRLLAMLFGLFVFGATITAADLTGTWRLDLNPNFGGMDQAVSCAFKQDDTNLSADCEGGQVTGKMDGSSVTLQVKTGRSNEFTAVFEGRVNQAGTTINGTWRLVDSLGERTGKFTLTKS